jgi:DNA polymerase-4
MAQRFGKMGRHLYKIVNALDDRPVNPNRIRKSIGAERTFSDDITHIREMKEKLDFLAEKIFSYLQKQDNYGRTVTLKMKRPDFTQHTRSRSYGGEIRQLSVLKDIAHQLLEENIEVVPAVRLLGLSISNLSREHPGGVQLLLPFEGEIAEEE